MRFADRALSRSGADRIDLDAHDLVEPVDDALRHDCRFRTIPGRTDGGGIAEAGFAPTANSLLGDAFPPAGRARAMGIYAAGIPIGIMVGLTVGGFVAQAYDWRTALMIVGAPGLIVALLLRLLTREPGRGASEPEAAVQPAIPFIAAVRALAAQPAFVHIVLGTIATSFSVTALSVWLPSFLIRAHGMSLTQVGLGLGLLTGVSGFAGTTLGGLQAARLARRGRHATLWLPAAGMALAGPLIAAALQTGSGQALLWALLVPFILANLWTAPSLALIQELAPVPARATASAISIMSSNLLGISLGPIAAGLLSDLCTATSGDPATGLRWALTAMALSLLWAAAH